MGTERKLLLSFFVEPAVLAQAVITVLSQITKLAVVMWDLMALLKVSLTTPISWLITAGDRKQMDCLCSAEPQGPAILTSVLGACRSRSCCCWDLRKQTWFFGKLSIAWGANGWAAAGGRPVRERTCPEKPRKQGFGRV